MSVYESFSGVLSPQVIVYDTAGNVINSWAPHPKGGEPNVLPEVAHGCFVDYEDSLWVTGLNDGIAQKWSHDGKNMLVQIGIKGKCDGPPDANPKSRHRTCGEKGSFNSSKTLLNEPANLWVDPDPDPVTRERGSVYVADGYGNHRVAVFDGRGRFFANSVSPVRDRDSLGLREMRGPGQLEVTRTASR